MLPKRKIIFLFIFNLLVSVIKSQQLYPCNPVGGYSVFYDSACSKGESFGCNGIFSLNLRVFKI
jgi:hypothetical protein